jgi:hypothetical protein
MSTQVHKIFNPLDWFKAAESRARDWYTQCRERSAQRTAAGGPSLAELQAAYQSLPPIDSGPGDHLSDYELMLAIREESRDEDALAALIHEELTARGTLEECVREETERYLSQARMQLVILPLQRN